MDPAGDGAETTVQLSERYGHSYTIATAPTTSGAVDSLRQFAEQRRAVALVLAHRTSATTVLDHVRDKHPRARRGLLLEWNESRSHREEIAVAFAHRRAECFVTKPSGPHDEHFHRNITELLDEWWRIRGSADVDVRLIGHERSPRIAEISDLLQRHDFTSAFHPRGSDPADRLLRDHGVVSDVDPVVVLRDGQTLVAPTNIEIATALGARTRAGSGTYDLVVVGGGPGGLSAAVYAESEGLRTALIEPTAMGGQAGTSSMIRNYLGFPRGVSGAELAARAFDQAILFGTEMIYGVRAVGLRMDGDLRVVELSNGSEVPARSVVIATGVSYRTLDVAGVQQFQGRGVYYGAALTEAPDLEGRHAFVVGGGNSAGQAAIYLAKFAQQVTILVRGDSLAASMSDYLITEMDSLPNLDVRYRTEVVGIGADARLRRVTLRDKASGAEDTVDAAGLFILVGAEPFTDWLPAAVDRDEWGYITTGPSDTDSHRRPFESTMPGVFAVGDVRQNSIKRVASAVGEGAICVRLVHDYLSKEGDHDRARTPGSFDQTDGKPDDALRRAAGIRL